MIKLSLRKAWHKMKVFNLEKCLLLLHSYRVSLLAICIVRLDYIPDINVVDINFLFLLRYTFIM